MEKTNEHIEKLKAFKPWFFQRWLGNYRAKHEAKKALREALARKHYIGTVFHYAWLNETHYATCWYACYQLGDGKRFYEFGTNDHRYDDRQYRLNVFPALIKPWLEGCYSNEDLQQYAVTSRTAPTVSPFSKIKKSE